MESRSADGDSDGGVPLTTLPPIHMTPLERMIEDHRTAFLLRTWYENEAYAAKAHAEIKAMVEVANRGIGQRFRYARARLRAKFQGDSHAE